MGEVVEDDKVTHAIGVRADTVREDLHHVLAGGSEGVCGVWGVGEKEGREGGSQNLHHVLTGGCQGIHDASLPPSLPPSLPRSAFFSRLWLSGSTSHVT